MKALIVTAATLTLASAQQVDLVKKGAESFHTWGCSECHVVTADDQSIKSGPSLYNLFLSEAKKRAVKDAAGKTSEVVADRNYFNQCVRQPASQLAIAADGPTKDQAYPAVMPQYTPEVVAEENLEAIWHYLRTCTEESQRGPATVMGEWKGEKGKVFYENPAHLLIGSRTKVQRAPIAGGSGRAIHVGLVSGVNYTFDPRFLSIRSIWGGGFLDLTEEQRGRGKPGSVRGEGANDMRDSSALLTPVTADGKNIDFAFKEPDWTDDDSIIHHLEKGGDFLKELASWDAEFLGYETDATGDPTFLIRVGKNSMKQKIHCDALGALRIEITGNIITEQRFILAENARNTAMVQGGKLDNGTWIIPAGTSNASLEITLPAAQARTAHPLKESLAAQPLVIKPGTADLPSGYQLEDWDTPVDEFGRKILFEPTAIAIAKDGTIVLGTRTAGVWRIRDKQWTLFAEGTYECLGLVIEDDKGDVVVIAQKPEITRLTDADGDGRAERFQTFCDDFGFHGNYHEYNHGLVRDKEGNYYFTLNLCHYDNVRASYKAGGNFMGTMGGYRGWACRVTPAGKFEPYANGLRSPAGLGMSPDGRLVFLENQGEYVGSSKIHFLEKDSFYGHPSGLVSLPGMKPSSPEIAFDKWKEKTRKSAMWFPHNHYANSPGHPAWDMSEGKFGPYSGQMFAGDQTLSTLLRGGFERIGDVDQGWMTLFARGLASGMMRPCFMQDGSLLLGQTGRGWVAKGGKVSSLQRIIKSGDVADILRISTEKDGFRIHFTNVLAKRDGTPTAAIRSWTYTDEVRYGSPQVDPKDHEMKGITIAPDRLSIHIPVAEFATPATAVDRLYMLKLTEMKPWLGDAARANIDAAITLRAIPK